MIARATYRALAVVVLAAAWPLWITTRRRKFPPALVLLAGLIVQTAWLVALLELVARSTGK
jgi:hypothetical protein